MMELKNGINKTIIRIKRIKNKRILKKKEWEHNVFSMRKLSERSKKNERDLKKYERKKKKQPNKEKERKKYLWTFSEKMK